MLHENTPTVERATHRESAEYELILGNDETFRCLSYDPTDQQTVWKCLLMSLN